jgi:sugar transferase (PEP-CTERM system associated)
MILRVFNIYIPLRRIIFFFLESFFIWGLVILAFYLRFWGQESQLIHSEDIVLKSLLVVVVVQISLYYFDLYGQINFLKPIEVVARLLQALSAASIILACLYYLFPQLLIGRGVFFILAMMMGTFFVWRLAYFYLVRIRGLNQKIIIIGTGHLAKAIAEKILQNNDSGFSVIGFISDDPERVGQPLVNPSIIGDYSMLPELVQREKPDRIIVALEERRGKFPLSQLLDLKLSGLAIEDGASFYEHLAGKLHIESLNPSNIIFSGGFRTSKFTLMLKRMVELSASLAVVVLFAPLGLLVSLLIKLESKGPVFYSQERVGKNGRIFKLFKFRSMAENAEANGPVWAGENDSRVTRVGHWLRKARLDEIPQMINVLKGDMSFVGPRPERPFFVEQLKKEIPYYAQRHTVHPGITGWSQIRYPYGASKEDALEKLKYDLYYIKNLSITFDLYIMFETARVVLLGKGSR